MFIWEITCSCHLLFDEYHSIEQYIYRICLSLDDLLQNWCAPKKNLKSVEIVATRVSQDTTVRKEAAAGTPPS